MAVPEHLQKAQAFLRDAQLCADHGRYDSAVSRAYYAMFRAAIALLEQYGAIRPGWNHGRLARILEQRMVHTKALFALSLTIATVGSHLRKPKQPWRGQITL